MLNSFRLYSILAALHLFNQVSAATFESDSIKILHDEMPIVRISGQIVPGDAKVFARIIRDKPDELRLRTYVALDSPGGDLKEAIALARIIREVGFDTIVEERARCVSACFVLYVAGFTRMGQLPLFSGRAETSIGVHRAFIDPEVMKTLEPSAASEVVRQSVKLSEASLREFDVPEDIIRLVQSTPAAAIRYLTSTQLSSFMEPPWLVDLAHARCSLVVPAASSSPVEGQKYFRRLAECESMVLFDHRLKRFPRMTKLK